MPLKGARYRYKKGSNVRLGFRGHTVVEAKNTDTGATHTPGEFAADRKHQAMAKARAGKKDAAERRTVKGGPPAGGYTSLG